MTAIAQTDNLPEVLAAARAELPDDIVAFIEECLRQEHPESHLIAVLHRVQEHFGYLACEKLDAIAQLMRIPAAKVAGVATFYHYFRMQPRGRLMINVCMGTACYVKGAEKVVDRIREELGIDFGQTTTDGIFSLNSALCLGTCGLAPVVMINDEVHGKVTPDQVPALLEKAMLKARESLEQG